MEPKSVLNDVWQIHNTCPFAYKNGLIDWDGFRRKYNCPEQLLLPREIEIDANAEIVGRQTDLIKQMVAAQKANTKNIMKYVL